MEAAVHVLMRTPRVILLPVPCLVVMIGAAGSGKSTLAARLFSPDAILSSDELRAVVAGDAADQRATRTAFAILHRELERRIAGGRTVVVDATSVTQFARRGLVARSVAHGVPAVAIVLDLEPGIVLSRNAARVDRVVPESVVRRHLADLGRSLRPGVLDAEGFAAVHVLRTPAEIDSLEVSLSPRTPPR